MAGALIRATGGVEVLCYTNYCKPPGKLTVSPLMCAAASILQH